MTDSNGIPKLYTIKELAEIIKVTERTLHSYVKNGRLKGVKIGGKWKVTEANLHKFFNGG
jgi:excisionase family DNA binding protein